MNDTVDTSDVDKWKKEMDKYSNEMKRKIGHARYINEQLKEKLTTLEKKVGKLEKDNESLQEEATDWEEAYKLTTDEFDNYKKRTPAGIEILKDFFGKIYEAKINELISKLPSRDKELIELLSAIDNEKERQLVAKFMVKQAEQLREFINKL